MAKLTLSSLDNVKRYCPECDKIEVIVRATVEDEVEYTVCTKCNRILDTQNLLNFEGEKN